MYFIREKSLESGIWTLFSKKLRSIFSPYSLSIGVNNVSLNFLVTLALTIFLGSLSLDVSPSSVFASLSALKTEFETSCDFLIVSSYVIARNCDLI